LALLELHDDKIPGSCAEQGTHVEAGFAERLIVGGVDASKRHLKGLRSAVLVADATAAGDGSVTLDPLPTALPRKSFCLTSGCARADEKPNWRGVPAFTIGRLTVFQLYRTVHKWRL
jgi:hypothetical protein